MKKVVCIFGTWSWRSSFRVVLRGAVTWAAVSSPPGSLRNRHFGWGRFGHWRRLHFFLSFYSSSLLTWEKNHFYQTLTGQIMCKHAIKYSQSPKMLWQQLVCVQIRIKKPQSKPSKNEQYFKACLNLCPLIHCTNLVSPWADELRKCTTQTDLVVVEGWSCCCIFLRNLWLRRSLSLLLTAVLYSDMTDLICSSKKAESRKVML